MAKWGEGDPRWIVEERPDATNVNNWHWTEKNACGWSKDKLKDLLTGLKIKNDIVNIKISELDKIEGDAVVNNRKGKLIFFYEWDISLTWKGNLLGSDNQIEGKINIPNLSEENDISEVEVEVTLKESTPEGETVKEILHNQGKDTVRQKLGMYILLLKEEFSKGMILPKKGEEENQTIKETQITNLSSGFNKKMQMNHVINKSSGTHGVKIDTATLKMVQNFQCTGKEFYRAMTVPEMVTAFTNAPAKVEAKKGGKFELFGGNIYGEFVELVEEKRIAQRWRSKRWPDEHYSMVTIDVEQQTDDTLVKITQTGVPESDADGTKENWNRYYWEAMKRTFGWGTFFM